MGKEPVRIVNLSGGKDSTAMLLWLLERNEPFDAVVFMDTGWEFPEMYAHMAQLKASIDVPVIRVTHTSSFDYMLTEYTLTKGQRRGLKGYGFCTPKSRWCTRLKAHAIKQWCSAHYPHRSICHYIGIAADETARQKKRTIDNATNRYPLVEWGKTEADCLAFCKDRGFTWGGLYEKRKRLSCWCCPLQSKDDLYILWSSHPELWERLKWMQSRSMRNFRADYTLEGLEHIFETGIKLTGGYEPKI